MGFAEFIIGPAGGRTRWLNPSYSSFETLPYLEQPRRPHAAADAHGDDGALGAAPPSFDQDMAGHARSPHAKGMTDRDRAAVHIEPFLRDAQPVAPVKHLARKRFVELPQIDIADPAALARHPLANCEHR